MKVAVATLIAAFVSVQATNADTLKDILESPDLTTLKAAVEAAGLLSVFEGNDDLTVFAPDNSAFDLYGPLGDGKSPLSHLLKDNAYSKGLLTELLKQHVVSGKILSTGLAEGLNAVTALNGESLNATRSGTSVLVESSRSKADVTSADVSADNGVAHVVNDVLFPEYFFPKTIGGEVGSSDSFTLLNKMVEEIQGKPLLKDVQENVWTVFAPLDTAVIKALDALELSENDFLGKKALVEAIINVHLLSEVALKSDISESGERYVSTVGGKIAVSQINSSIYDMKFLNGVVHSVDTVILPTLYSETSSSDSLSTLNYAVELAGLADALSNLGKPLTVFAPTNAAFAALGGIVDYLVVGTEWSTGLLTEVLTYHVLDGKKTLSDLKDEETTLNGQKIKIEGGKINGVSVINATDVGFAQNGAVHLINSVLIPEGFPTTTITAGLAATTSGYETIKAALTKLSLLGMFDTAGKAYTVFVPTDEAFIAALAALGVTADELLEDTETLTTILTAHVVETPVTFEEVGKLTDFATLGGEVIKVSQLQVKTPDQQFLNGIVHFVDAVIVPPSITLPTDKPTASPTKRTTSSPSSSASVKALSAMAVGAAMFFQMFF